MEPMLKVTDLSVSYGHVEALRGVSIQVEQGQIVSIIGANGAGKSTLLRTISGLVKPLNGRVEFLGEPLPKKPNKVQQPADRAKGNRACAGGPQDFFRPDHPG